MSKRSEKRHALDQKKAERRQRAGAIELAKNGGVPKAEEYVSPMRGQPISPVVEQVFKEHLAVVEIEKQELIARQAAYELESSAYHRAQREHATWEGQPYYYTVEEQERYAEQLANPPELLTIEEIRWLHARQQPFHLYYGVITLDLEIPEQRAVMRSIYAESGMAQVRSQLVANQWVLLNQLPAERRWRTFPDDMLPSDWVAQHGSTAPPKTERLNKPEVNIAMAAKEAIHRIGK